MHATSAGKIFSRIVGISSYTSPVKYLKLLQSINLRKSSKLTEFKNISP